MLESRIPVLTLLWALAWLSPAPASAADAPGPAMEADAVEPAAPREGGDSADSEAQAASEESPATEDAEVEAPPPPLWLEFYGEAVGSRHEDDNIAGFTDTKVGKRLPGPLKADLYGRIRYYRDGRDFYWNNRADAGIGIRVPLLRKVSLTAFAEAAWGRYLSLASGALPLERLQVRVERNRAAIDAAQKSFQALYKEVFKAAVLEDPAVDRATIKYLDTAGNSHLQALARLDAQLDSLETSKDSLGQAMDSVGLVPAGEVAEYKAGLVFWHGWGRPADDADPPSRWFAFPIRPWGEVYADCVYSSLSRHVRARGAGGEYRDSVARFSNLIAYANPAAGLLVMEGRAGSLAALVSAYLWFDTRGDWWNNRAMAGPGLRYQPLRDIDLAIKAEWMFGRYYGRERAQDPNPYAKGFSDARLTAGFWHGLGI